VTPQVGNLGHEDGGPADRFEVDDVLRGHDGERDIAGPCDGRREPLSRPPTRQCAKHSPLTL
jgi:hypothetical protein